MELLRVSVGCYCIGGSREIEAKGICRACTNAGNPEFLRQAAGGRQFHRLGTRVRRQTGLGSCSSEEEVSASAQNWPRVQRELLRARSWAETCYFPLSSLFDCHSLRPFSNDWVYLTPTRRQRSSSLGSKKVSAFPWKAASLSPLIQLFLLEQSPVERSTDIQNNVNDQCKSDSF